MRVEEKERVGKWGGALKGVEVRREKEIRDSESRGERKCF